MIEDFGVVNGGFIQGKLPKKMQGWRAGIQVLFLAVVEFWRSSHLTQSGGAEWFHWCLEHPQSYGKPLSLHPLSSNLETYRLKTAPVMA